MKRKYDFRSRMMKNHTITQVKIIGYSPIDNIFDYVFVRTCLYTKRDVRDNRGRRQYQS